MDQDYRILTVEARQAYQTDYGEMQPYAITLEGVEGYVQLTQKPETPAPMVGQTIHGHTYSQGKYLKFKKVNPEFAQQGGGGSKPSSAQPSADNGYIIKLLEAIAVEVGAQHAVRGDTDTVLEDIDDKPIDLSEIPF